MTYPYYPRRTRSILHVAQVLVLVERTTTKNCHRHQDISVFLWIRVASNAPRIPTAPMVTVLVSWLTAIGLQTLSRALVHKFSATGGVAQFIQTDPRLGLDSGPEQEQSTVILSEGWERPKTPLSGIKQRPASSDAFETPRLVA